MPYQKSFANKCIKIRQRLLKHRRVFYHVVIDVIHLRRPKRNRSFRVYQGGKGIHNLAFLHFNCGNLDYRVACPASPCRFQVKDNIISNVFIDFSSSFISKHILSPLYFLISYLIQLPQLTPYLPPQSHGRQSVSSY